MKNLHKFVIALALIPTAAFVPFIPLEGEGEFTADACSVGAIVLVERNSIEDYLIPISLPAYFESQEIVGVAMLPTLLPQAEIEASTVGIAMLPTLLPPEAFETTSAGLAMLPTLLPQGELSSLIQVDCQN